MTAAGFLLLAIGFAWIKVMVINDPVGTLLESQSGGWGWTWAIPTAMVFLGSVLMMLGVAVFLWRVLP